ncbi:phospholipase D-like domain-containing protein [Oxynema aestuarii]|jgi:cardiolipin synthase|uniref:Phosphatidylserine/phosphatidylglycerophosphate/ cardiolipin synthase family protein n=1 Tax=Oxynema aestuarii AP17 TaxID=2064643 RepID=A0A6H1U3V9_9CYAN|nr:phosphatidylserine/phosphatidylglycerophosphate/cardiolipin synthase family protein [Oxynema aestuarii]QIZ73335.1 phosphatidylserine/phosphatidylglycerophosphate/cardiolipin synthase family protein [Oxynema aestuarii AP17]
MNGLIWWMGGSAIGIFALIFFVLYIRGTFRDRVEYKIEHLPNPEAEYFPLAIASLSNSVVTSGYCTDFWNDPDRIQRARLEAIQKARRTIHFETFFMTPGRRANDFADAIADRAIAGVEVKLIVDDYGTSQLPKSYWQRLQNAGVKIRIFNAFNWKAPANYAGRSHRKLLLVDGELGLVGGAGISDRWDGWPKIGDTQPWFDCEFRLEGAIVSVLEGMFLQHWTYCGGQGNLSKEMFIPHEDSENNPQFIVTPGANPSYRSSGIRALFQTAIIAARKRIWLASPYFLPDPNSRKMLVAARNRGIDVQILTTSQRCDKQFVYYASYETYGKLLKAGIKIHQHQPSMLHAKLLLIDDCWVSTGSANFDPRSFFHNDELDFSSGDRTLVGYVQKAFEEGFARSQTVSFSDWKARSLEQRLMGRLVSFIQWEL